MLTRLLAASRGSGGFTQLSPDYGVGMGSSGLTGTSLTKLGVMVAPGGAGSWNEALVESPAVWLDPGTGKYCMVAAGYAAGPNNGKIGVWTATAPDGPWTAYASNPIFASSGSGADAGGVTGPFIWIRGSTYHLFYIGFTGAGYEGGASSLLHASSTDFVPGTNAGTWTRHGQIIGATSGWRSTQVYHPSIIQVGSTYYLFFNAFGSNEAIGYATSSDLSAWTVDDVNSPVVNKGAGGTWEQNWVGDPSLYKVGSTYWMAYYGYNAVHAKDGLASASSFPTTWTKYGSNPVLDVGGSGSIDETHAHKPYIFQTNSAMYHYYTAVSAANVRQIACAQATA